MLDAFTIKQWLLVYFCAGVGLWALTFCVVWGVKRKVDQLVTETELVRYLRENQGR